MGDGHGSNAGRLRFEGRRGNAEELLGLASIGRFLPAGPGNRGDLSHEIKALVRFIVFEVRSDAVEHALFHIDEHGETGEGVVEPQASFG